MLRRRASDLSFHTAWTHSGHLAPHKLDNAGVDATVSVSYLLERLRGNGDQVMENTATGSCHCGAVKIEVPFDGSFKKLRRCDCSYCSRRWAVVASVKVDDLTVVEGEDKLSLYQWGTGTARHFFCSVCGIYTHHQRRSDPTEFGINIANFEGVNVRDFMGVGYVDGVNHSKDQK